MCSYLVISSWLTALGVEGGWCKAKFDECTECTEWTDSAYWCDAFVAGKEKLPQFKSGGFWFDLLRRNCFTYSKTLGSTLKIINFMFHAVKNDLNLDIKLQFQ